jgi:hypothetical protein
MPTAFADGLMKRISFCEKIELARQIWQAFLDAESRGNRSILRISGRSSIYADISGHKVSPCTDISLSSEVVRLAIFRDNERNPPSCAVSASCDFPESQV